MMDRSRNEGTRDAIVYTLMWKDASKTDAEWREIIVLFMRVSESQVRQAHHGARF